MFCMILKYYLVVICGYTNTFKTVKNINCVMLIPDYEIIIIWKTFKLFTSTEEIIFRYLILMETWFSRSALSHSFSASKVGKIEIYFFLISQVLHLHFVLPCLRIVVNFCFHIMLVSDYLCYNNLVLCRLIISS